MLTSAFEKSVEESFVEDRKGDDYFYRKAARDLCALYYDECIDACRIQENGQRKRDKRDF